MPSNEALTRWSAVVPVLVGAGCAEPSSTFMDLHNIPEVAIAALEKWFRETVVVWFRSNYANCQIPDEVEGLWVWGIEWCGKWQGRNDQVCPTEANIACAEALAKLVGDTAEGGGG